MVRVEPEPGGEAVRLVLGGDAPVTRRFHVIEPRHHEAWGLVLEFSDDDRLVGVIVEDPARHLSAEVLAGDARPELSRDDDVGAAYLALEPVDAAGVDVTIAFADDDRPPAGSINLDFARGRLVGIEFLDGRQAP